MELRVFCLLLLLVLFSACGQKGDLYLPEREPPAPAETEQDVDDIEQAGEEEGGGR